MKQGRLISCMTLCVVAIVMSASAGAFAMDVKIQWDPNDGAEYYEIHYGTQSKQYTNVSSRIYAPQTQYMLAGLEECTWYFSIIAVNKSGVASDFSDEIVYVPPVKPKSFFKGGAKPYVYWAAGGGVFVILGLILAVFLRKRADRNSA